MFIQIELPFSSEVNSAWFSCPLSLPPPVLSIWNGMCMCYQPSAKNELASSLPTIKWEGAEVPEPGFLKLETICQSLSYFVVYCFLLGKVNL